MEMILLLRNMYEYIRYIKYCYYICCAFVGMDNTIIHNKRVAAFNTRISAACMSYIKAYTE